MLVIGTSLVLAALVMLELGLPPGIPMPGLTVIVVVVVVLVLSILTCCCAANVRKFGIVSNGEYRHGRRRRLPSHIQLASWGSTGAQWRFTAQMALLPPTAAFLLIAHFFGDYEFCC